MVSSLFWFIIFTNQCFVALFLIYYDYIYLYIKRKISILKKYILYITHIEFIRISYVGCLDTFPFYGP